MTARDIREFIEKGYSPETIAEMFGVSLDDVPCKVAGDAAPPPNFKHDWNRARFKLLGARKRKEARWVSSSGRRFT